jgi:hypothetical protein
MSLPLVHLMPHEAAFILQRHPAFSSKREVSEQLIRASLRRAERLANDRGLTPYDTLHGKKPAVPVSYDGAGRRRVPLWAVRELVADDSLATAFLDAIIERRIRCPRPIRASAPAPSFSAWLRLL